MRLFFSYSALEWTGKRPAPGPVGGKQKSPGQEAEAKDFVRVGKISLLHFPMRYTSFEQIHKEVYA